jgi:hypothetical protein
MPETNQLSDIDKAVELVEKNGYIVVNPPSLLAKPYISELSALFESANYRLDEAKIERDEHGIATGRILLAVYPFQTLEHKTREGTV